MAGQGMSREKAKNALQARKKGPPGPWYLSGYFVGPPLRGIGGGEPFSSTPPLTCCTLACG